MSNFDFESYLQAQSDREKIRRFDNLFHMVLFGVVGTIFKLLGFIIYIEILGYKDLLNRVCMTFRKVSKLIIITVLVAVTVITNYIGYVSFETLLVFKIWGVICGVLGLIFYFKKRALIKKFKSIGFLDSDGKAPKLISIKYLPNSLNPNIIEFNFKTVLDWTYFEGLEGYNVFKYPILECYSNNNTSTVVTAIPEIIEELNKPKEKIDFKDDENSLEDRIIGVFEYLNLNIRGLNVKHSNKFATLMYFNSSEVIGKITSTMVVEEIKNRLKLFNLNITTSDMKRFDYMLRIMHSNTVIRFYDMFNEIREKAKSMILPVMLGLSTEGEIVLVDYANKYNSIVAGTIRSGKTNTMKQFFSSLHLSNKNVTSIIIDTKKDMTSYKGLDNVFYCDDVVTALITLQWVLNEVKRRNTLFSKVNHVSNIIEYNSRTRKELPYILLVVEELADLLMSGNKKVNEKFLNIMSRIAQICGSSGVKCFYNTQKPTNDILGTLIKSSCPERYCHIVGSATDSRVILDSSEATNLSVKGTYIAKFNQELQYFKASLVDDIESEKISNELKEIQKARKTI